MNMSAALKERALEIGFDLAGVAPLTAWRDLEFSRTWVERGYGGEMRYLENPKRDDPRRILPSVNSVICVGLVYNTSLPYSTEACGENSQKVAGREENERQKAQSKATPNRKKEARNRGRRAEDRRFELPVSAGRAGQKTEPSRTGPAGWISRYAWGRDYHEIMRSKLEKLRMAVENLAPGVETRAYVDTGPIVERAFARLSGIGWMGKNTCLINQAKGSWFFLGAMLTNLELEADLPAFDRCGSCTRCLEACPTGALVEPYVMDASRCIAYFTIELKGSIPTQFRTAIGANVFGCDICQDVCPWNSKHTGELPVLSDQPSIVSGQHSVRLHHIERAATTTAAEFHPTVVEIRTGGAEGPKGGESNPKAADQKGSGSVVDSFSLFNPPLEKLASLSEEDFRGVFSHSPIKRVKYRGWLRNLCVAIGNSADPRFVPWLEKAREHEHPLVRDHAAWALERIKG